MIKKINIIEKHKEYTEIEAKIKDARYQETKTNNLLRNKHEFYFFAIYCHEGINYGCSSISIIECSISRQRKELRKLKEQEKCKIYVNSKQPHLSYLISPQSHKFLKYYISIIVLTLMSIITTMV